MSYSKFFVAFVLAVLLGLAPAVSHAAGEGEEVSVKGLHFTIMGGETDWESPQSDQGSTRVTAWVRFNEHVGIEGGYADYGNNLDGLHLALTPTYVLPGGVTLLGTFGWALGEDNAMLYGGGFLYDLSHHVSLRAEWNRLEDTGDAFLIGLSWHFKAFVDEVS
ncbi:MAG: hypothetical protein VCA74_07150 [Deltaproteobacteria bacterium]